MSNQVTLSRARILASFIPMHNQPLIDQLYRQQSRRVLATLIRLPGDFDLAEEAMQEAFVAAVQQWPEEGMPDDPAV